MYLGVTTSDPTLAQVLYPAALTFTSSSWNETQKVVIEGHDRGVPGSYPFDVDFFVISSRDPSYANAEALTTYTFRGLVNKGGAYEAVAVWVNQNGCTYVTESGNKCVLTVTLCYYPVLCTTSKGATTCNCDTYLKYDDSFSQDVESVVVRLKMSVPYSSTDQFYWNSSSSAVVFESDYYATITFTSDFDTKAAGGKYRVNLTVSAISDGIYDGNYAASVTVDSYVTYNSDGTIARYPTSANLTYPHYGASVPSASTGIYYVAVDDGPATVFDISSTSCTVQEGRTCKFNLTTVSSYLTYEHQGITVSVPHIKNGLVSKKAATGYISMDTCGGDCQSGYLNIYYMAHAQFTPGIGWMDLTVHGVRNYLVDGSRTFNISVKGWITGLQPVCKWTAGKVVYCNNTYALKGYNQTATFTVNVTNVDTAGELFAHLLMSLKCPV